MESDPFNDPSSSADVTATQGEYYLEQMRRMRVAQERQARIAFDKTHPVDEYISSFGVPQSDATYTPYTSYVELQPTWEIPEKINTILATIPAGATACTAKLGDRYFDLMSAAVAGSGGQLSKGLLEVVPANPSAGAGYEYTNDLTTPLLLNSVTATLATDSVAANRLLRFQWIDPNGNIAEECGDTTDIVASSTVLWYGALGISDTGAGANGHVYGPLPYLILEPGWSFKITVGAMDPGDQLENIVLAFQQNQLTQAQTVILNDLGIILNRSDDRLMLLQGTLTAGPTHFELMGYADEIWGNA
jgi:hypothetical protein